MQLTHNLPEPQYLTVREAALAQAEILAENGFIVEIHPDGDVWRLDSFKIQCEEEI